MVEEEPPEAEAEMTEFEERVGFKSMERNAGVWGER